MSEASTVVTSENAAEFYANKLGLADVSEPTEAAIAEPEPELTSEPKEAETAEQPKEKQPNPKLEKRFSELTKQREQARQEAERERTARQELESRIREMEARLNPQPQVVDEDDEPRPDQFRDAYEYAKALAEFSAEKALKERDRQEATKREQETKQKVLETWKKRVEETKAELTDFDDMVGSADVVISDQVRDAILESDVGPKIVYHLAENPEVAEKLKTMSVSAALREIGKLEARFERKETQETPRANKSSAPAPISPLRGTGTVSDLVEPDKMSYAQWKAARKSGKIR